MDKLSEVVEHIENLEGFEWELQYAPVEVRKCDRGRQFVGGGRKPAAAALEELTL